MLVLLGIGILSCLLFYYIQSPFKYWKNKHVINPPISYLFGNLGDVVFLRKSIGQAYHDIYNKYSNLPYVGCYKMRSPVLLIRDPELVKEVLVKSFNSFHDNDIFVDKKMDPLSAKNPFASKGAEWKVLRNQSSPSFTPKRIREMYPSIKGVAQNLVKYINTNLADRSTGVDAKKLCIKYTTDAVVSCALGLEGNSFENPNSEYIKMMDKILSPSFGNTIKFVVLFVIPSLANILKVKFIPDDAAMYYKTIVSKTIAYRTKNKLYRGDFLDGMSELQQKLGKDNFTIEDITAHAAAFFTEGTETAAIVLSFLLYELALHPDVQWLLRKEIDEALCKTEGNLDYDTILSMEYLDQIFCENMRKNPPAPILTRVCTEDITLETPNGNGEFIRIDRGTSIVIPIYSIHLDSKYHPNPTLFDPNRFSQDNMQSLHKYSYIPFGEGPRICLGQRFGIAQTKVAVVHIIEKFEVLLNKATKVPYEIDPHYFLLSPKNGIQLEFRSRK